MEENKFEKQVQQKMDELQIQPSDAVWEKIASQIEKKKTRKWGLLILFLFVGVFLSGGYWLWNARQHNISENNNSAKAIFEKNNDANSTKKNKINRQQITPVMAPVHQENNEVAEKENKKTHKFLTNSIANQKIKSPEKNSIAFSKKKEKLSEINGNAEIEILPAQLSQPQSVNKNINKETGDSIHEKINFNSSSETVVSILQSKNSDTSKKRQNTTETVKQLKKNKWAFGISLSGGISAAGDNFLGLDNSIPKDFPSSVTTGQTLRILPSQLKPGLGFVAGVFAEKNISRKTKLLLGINFKSFNTSIKLYDSAGTYTAATYSLNSGVNKYTSYINHFNFIEVPVSIKIQIGKGKNVPVVWQGGFAVAELISSNALQIIPNTGYYYYRDNSIFTKTQIAFNTGFFASLVSKQKTSILIGPYFYYDASKIANEGLYDKKHFVFAGLHTEIIFGK